MVGCGEEWCYYPWDALMGYIVLKLAMYGRDGMSAGVPYNPVCGG